MTVALRAEGLGKCYLVQRMSDARHSYGSVGPTLQDQFHYRTLREEVALWLRALTGRGAARDRETKWALRNVGFEVNEGEAVGIIGRNGAGKSTLLKVLARITEPTSGHVDVRGRVGALLEVGTGFHPELTGRENIELSGAIYGMRRHDLRRRFDDIIAFSEVGAYLDMPLKRYSSGMYMRLAFAVAAHLEPDLLLVDEVLAVGDAAFQKKCLTKMQEVGREGRTVLFVSHDMAAVGRLCSRTILLQDGEVLRDGPTAEVASAYLAAGGSAASVRDWPDAATAPGDDTVRLRAVRLRGGPGAVTDTFDVRESLQIEVEYDNHPSLRRTAASIQLFDEGGVCLFTSGDFTNPRWRSESRQFDGRVRAICHLPGNLLAEGLKRVTVQLVTQNPDVVLVEERDAVSFMMVDRSEGDGARGEFGGAFPGVMRPLLPWTVELPQGKRFVN